jgi:hypothetical protein
MACKEDIRVALVFKDLAYWLRSSCVGLNVAAYANAIVLNEHGIHTVVFPVCHNIHIVEKIDQYNDNHEHKLTHVIISAPWLTRHELRCMLEAYPDIQFIIICHSNVGFLQSDLSAMELIRFYHDLEDEFPNLLIGGNSCKFVKWLSRAYDWDDVVFLPNLYPVRNIEFKEWEDESVLKIGAFGAVRPEKNFMTAAAAALVIHSKLGVPLEFHMLKGMDYNSVTKAIRDMLNGLPDVTLVEHNWAYWDDFVQLVGEMDLLIQVSYTESFNMITCDGIYMGVPSVTSSAISWSPKEWQANADDAIEVSEVGVKLLFNPRLRREGLAALKRHVRKGLKHWFKVLDIHDECWFSKFWNDMVEIFKG